MDLPRAGKEKPVAALTEAGFTNVWAAPISAGYSLPAADEYLLEFHPFVCTFPAFEANVV
jgi:hypothetical protein